jgi:thymidylate synthase
VKVYLDTLRHVLDNGLEHEDRTGVGTLSVFGYQNRHDLKKGFPLLTTKRMPLRWVAEELFWFLSGSTDEAELRERGVDIWKEWADAEHTSRFGREPGDLGPVYGYLWRSFGGNYPERDGVDQIARLIHEIRHNPNSRRLIVSGWNPPTSDKVDLPPCHTLFQLKVEQNKVLHCQLYQRSADVFLGVPFNIASYALLTHLVARVCELDVGCFVHTFGDLHLYNNHIEQAVLQVSRQPYPLPQVSVSDELRGKGLDGLLAAEWSHIKLTGYRHHPRIDAEVAV